MAQPQTLRAFTTQSPEGVPGAKPRPHFISMVRVGLKSFRACFQKRSADRSMGIEAKFVWGQTHSSVQLAQRAGPFAATLISACLDSEQRVLRFRGQKHPHQCE